MRFVLQLYSIFLVNTHFNIVVESEINDNHTNIEQLNISDNFIRRFAIISSKWNDISVLCLWRQKLNQLEPDSKCCSYVNPLTKMTPRTFVATHTQSRYLQFDYICLWRIRKSTLKISGRLNYQLDKCQCYNIIDLET